MTRKIDPLSRYWVWRTLPIGTFLVSRCLNGKYPELSPGLFFPIIFDRSKQAKLIYYQIKYLAFNKAFVKKPNTYFRNCKETARIISNFFKKGQNNLINPKFNVLDRSFIRSEFQLFRNWFYGNSINSGCQVFIKKNI